jgi:hypothetical protein
MPLKSEVEFLLSELERWYVEGDLDHDRYQRLRRQYLNHGEGSEQIALPLPPPAAAPAVAAIPLPAAPLPESAPDLEQELAQQAERLLEADPPPVRVDTAALQASVEAEAGYHLELEARVGAARTAASAQRAAVSAQPAAQRTAALGDAVASAAAELIGAGEGAPQAAAQVVSAAKREVIARDSLWSTKLRPFFDENALWLAGGLLVIFGSLYFLRLIWDDLSSLMLRAVIAGSLLAYAGLFFGAGYALSRKRDAHGVGRILFCFSAALLPLSSVATGELAASLATGAAGLLVAGVAILVALAAQGVMLAVMAGLFERSSMRLMVRTGLLLGLGTMCLAPALTLLAPQSSALLLLGTALGFAALAWGLRALCTHRVHLRTTILFAGGGLLWSFFVLAGRVQAAALIPWTHYAPLVAALAALLISCDHRLRARGDNDPRLSALGLTFHTLALFAVALSLVGLARQGYFDLWARISVMLTSAVALYCLTRAALRYGRSAMTHLAASVGLLTYFFLPAPFSGLLRLAQRWIHSALGYQNAPLPVSYYGLTFIPYLLLLTALVVILRRRGREDLSRDLQWFAMALGGVLALLAAAGGTEDLRPMLWTWPIYAAGAFAWARLFRRSWLVYGGHAVTLALLWTAGVWAARAGLHPLAGASVALALPAVLAAAAALVWRRQAHLGHVALAAAALSPLALLVHPGAAGLELVFATLALDALVLALVTWRFRWRVTAHIAALHLPVALVVGCAVWAPGVASTLPLFAALAGLAGLVVHLTARSKTRSAVRQLVGQPATAVSLLGNALLLGVSLATNHPIWAPALAMLMLCHLLVVTRSATVTALCGIGASGGLAALSQSLLANSWPVTLGLLAPLLVLASAWVGRSSWYAARARGLSLLVVAFAAEAVGLHAAAALGADGGALRWAVLAGGCATLFCLTLTFVYRQRGALGVPAMVCLAAASTLTAALGLHLWVGSSTSSAWLQGALFAGLSLGWSVAAGALARRKALRMAASTFSWLMLVVPAGCVATFLLLAVLRCGGGIVGQLPLALVSLQPGFWALACALLLLLATARIHALHRRGASLQLVVGGAAALALVGAALVAPGAHLSLALGALAVVLAALRATRWSWGRSIHLGWSLALAGATIVASHGHLAGPPNLLIGVAALTAALVLAWIALRRRRGFDVAAADALAYCWAACAAATLQVMVLWLATVFSTGRYPAASVLALLAPTALLSGMALDRLPHLFKAGLEAAGRLGRVVLVVAAAQSLAAVALCSPLPSFVLTFCIGTLTALSAYLLLVGRRDEREWLLHAAGVTLLGLYWVVRWSWAGLAWAGPWFDAAALLAAVQSALWLSRGRVPAEKRALLAPALTWPLLALGLLPQLGPGQGALLALLIGAHYAAGARVLETRHLGVPAALFANAALFLSYASVGWSDVMLYVVPLCMTSLLLVQVYAAELGPTGAKALRTIALLSLYVIGTSRALMTLDALQTLVVVPGICVAGIIAGTLLRVRVYVLMGVGFLAADLCLNMVHYGLARPHLGALFLTLLGLLLVAGMVVFSLERERILRRYSAIFTELRTWD